MNLYGRVWLASSAALVGIGILLAMISLPVSALVGLSLLAAALACAILGIREGQTDVARLRCSARFVRKYLQVALVGAAIGQATVGWVAATGPLGVTVVVLLTASAPPTVSWVRQKRGSHPEATPPADSESEHGHLTSASTWLPAAPAVGQPMDHLSDEDVVFAWRCSYIVLIRARSAAELTSIIDIRSRCLDELERRNPTGFTRWIAAGARAASDPSRYTNSTRNVDSTE